MHVSEHMYSTLQGPLNNINNNLTFLVSHHPQLTLLVHHARFDFIIITNSLIFNLNDFCSALIILTTYFTEDLYVKSIIHHLLPPHLVLHLFVTMTDKNLIP